MKKLIVLCVILLISSSIFSQRKSKDDPRDAQIDLLTLQLKNLTLQLDSVSLELVKYLGVYNAIKDKVLHYNFDPTRSAFLIDSIKASRDSVSTLFLTQSSTTMAADSITRIKESQLLNIPTDEMEKAKAISSLKQLKELLDAKIITEVEFMALKNKYLVKL